MKKIDILILLDYRNIFLLIYGKMKEREMVIRKIEKYVGKLFLLKLWVYDLKGEIKLLGLMKVVIMMYGVNFKGLKELLELLIVELDYRSYRIRMLGFDEVVDKVVVEIDGLMNYLWEKCNILNLN